MLKSNHIAQSNYFVFENFFQPNIKNTILCLLSYNDDLDKFTPIFSPGIILSSLKSLLFNNNIEFILVDSNQTKVEVGDLCQLFISLELLS
jgi:hypothetical protein